MKCKIDKYFDGEIWFCHEHHMEGRIPCPLTQCPIGVVEEKFDVVVASLTDDIALLKKEIESLKVVSP